MNRSVSLYLDVVRVVATLAVLFQHLSRFNGNVYSGLEQYGHPAVIAFFVLSGYVIAYVANEREKTFENYLTHRFARMYSVLIAAWVVTALLDTSLLFINGDKYNELIATDYLFVRIISHIFFLHEAWFTSIQFFGNQPLWSLAYEFYYYILFGVLFLYQGKYKYWLAGFVALLMGPVILLYGIIWAFGVPLYKAHNLPYAPSKIISSIIFPATLLILFTHHYWRDFINVDVIIYNKLNLTHLARDFAFAFFVAINIYFFKYSIYSFALIKSPVRFLSSISFSIYVFHFPLMYFIGEMLMRYFDLSNEIRFFTMVVLIIYTVYLLSFISEKRKRFYFRIFDKLFKNIKLRLQKKYKYDTA